MSLFPYAMALALSFGAIRVIGVVSSSIARLYRRFGLDLRNMGVGTPPVPTDIVACSIDLGRATFHKLQCDPLMLMDSITRFGQFPPPEAGMPDHALGETPPSVCDKATVPTQATI
jgi:acyl homoserine lactone synthase